MSKEDRKAKRELADEYDLNFIQRIIINKTLKWAIKKVSNMKGSWRTTLAGFVTAFGILLTQAQTVLDNDPTTQPSVAVICGAVMTIGGLLGIGMSARDKRVSSESEAAAGTKVE